MVACLELIHALNNTAFAVVESLSPTTVDTDIEMAGVIAVISQEN